MGIIILDFLADHILLTFAVGIIVASVAQVTMQPRTM